MDVVLGVDMIEVLDTPVVRLLAVIPGMHPGDAHAVWPPVRSAPTSLWRRD